jgi:hypothetical protein
MNFIGNLSNNFCYENDFTLELFQSVIKIWKNEYFKKVFRRFKDSVHISDGSEYLLNKMTKIKPINYKDYVPDLIDILYTSKITTGIKEYHTKYKKIKMKIFDVGGSRFLRNTVNFNK